MSLQPDTWTRKTRDAWQAAEVAAREAKHREFGLPHLLQALVSQENGLVPALLQAAGVAPALASRLAEEALAKLPKVQGGVPPVPGVQGGEVTPQKRVTDDRTLEKKR